MGTVVMAVADIQLRRRAACARLPATQALVLAAPLGESRRIIDLCPFPTLRRAHRG
jgi:hypothetical protein